MGAIIGFLFLLGLGYGIASGAVHLISRISPRLANVVLHISPLIGVAIGAFWLYYILHFGTNKSSGSLSLLSIGAGFILIDTGKRY